MNIKNLLQYIDGDLLTNSASPREVKGGCGAGPYERCFASISLTQSFDGSSTPGVACQSGRCGGYHLRAWEKTASRNHRLGNEEGIPLITSPFAKFELFPADCTWRFTSLERPITDKTMNIRDTNFDKAHKI